MSCFNFFLNIASRIYAHTGLDARADLDGSFGPLLRNMLISQLAWLHGMLVHFSTHDKNGDEDEIHKPLILTLKVSMEDEYNAQNIADEHSYSILFG